MCFPQFSAISRSPQKCSKWPENEKNNHRWDLTRMVSSADPFRSRVEKYFACFLSASTTFDLPVAGQVFSR
jgi:hypothetical protein